MSHFWELAVMADDVSHANASRPIEHWYALITWIPGYKQKGKMVSSCLRQMGGRVSDWLQRTEALRGIRVYFRVFERRSSHCDLRSASDHSESLLPIGVLTFYWYPL